MEQKQFQDHQQQKFSETVTGKQRPARGKKQMTQESVNEQGQGRTEPNGNKWLEIITMELDFWLRQKSCFHSYCHLQRYTYLHELLNKEL